MYTEPIIEERVSELESLFGHFITSVTTSLNRLSREMKVFKDEMKVFKDEMKDFKDEMKDFKDEMKDFKVNLEIDRKNEAKEMKDFKVNLEIDRKNEAKEMNDFKINLEIDRKNETKDWNKKWGQLSNKLGSIVEDIISPAARPVIENQFKDKIDTISINIKRFDRKLNLEGEFDVVAISEHYLYLIEVKSTPRLNYLDDFQSNIEKFKILFPEYNDKKLVPILAGLRFDDNFVNFATERKMYVMAYREWEYMDILNIDKIERE
jgi:hypothetical protein